MTISRKIKYYQGCLAIQDTDKRVVQRSFHSKLQYDTMTISGKVDFIKAVLQSKILLQQTDKRVYQLVRLFHSKFQ